MKPISAEFGARARASTLCVVLAVGLAACSWLVNPEEEGPKCSSKDAGDDPCPKGTSCLDGRCRIFQCVAGEKEICGDGVDNDCNGRTDEPTNEPEMCNNADDDCDGKKDEDHDRDNDGFTWCGDLNDDSSADCDNLNDKVRPGGEELCDGLDNNCNGVRDESTDGKLCRTEGETCIEGRCVVPSCAIEGSGKSCSSDETCVIDRCEPKHCSETMCSAGNYCDQLSGTCVPLPTQRENGEGCSAASDCRSKLCIDAAAMRLTGTPSRICGQACCNDGDCENGELCFASGTGARSCLPPLTVAAGPRQCSHGADCPNAQRCKIALVLSSNEGDANFGTGLCRTPDAEDRDFGERCTMSESCASQLCLPSPVDILGVCSAPCRTSADCAGLDKGEGFPITRVAFGKPHEYCRFVDLGQIVGTPYANDYAAACVMDYETGGVKNFGESCSGDRECTDGVCVATPNGKGYCAPTCCSDLQCEAMAGGQRGARCAPLARGGHYEMRCTPKQP
jgi:hypothetical protein